jgi:membrane protein
MENERKFDLSSVTEFLSTGIWRIRASDLRGSTSFLIRQLRIILLAARGFNDDRCQLRASALTFYSLLSVVPLIAMAFGVSKGFGLEERLEKQLLKALPDQQEVVTRIVEYARSFLERTEGGLIAGVGVAVLFWTVIKLMGNIEKSFNDIWGVRKGRSLGRRFADYLSLMLIAPLLFATASSTTVLITSQVSLLTDKIPFLASSGPLFMWLLKLLPYCVTWILFTVLYVLMPNTTVKIKSGLLGGILAGTMYQVVQWIYIKFQVGASTHGAIYGSFAALPLFLIWLQMSWLVVLLGAEISFAAQHVDTYEFEPDCDKVSNHLKRLLALRITQLCVQNFLAKTEPRTAEQISDSLGVPIRLVRQALSALTEARVLSEVRTEDEKTSAYQPARAIDSLTVREVIDLLDQSGVDTIPYGESPEWEKLAERLNLFNETIRASSVDMALKDL